MSVEAQVLQSADGNLHQHSLAQSSYLCLVDVTAEYKVAHVGNACYGGSVVEGVAQNHRVAHLHRNVENHSADGRAYQGAAGARVACRYTVAHHLQIVCRGFLLFLRLLQSLVHFVILVCTHQSLVEEHLLAFVVHLSLLEVDISQSQTALCRTQLPHVGYHLHLGNHLASGNIFARHLIYLCYDAAYLRFHVHLVARFYLACDYC